MFRYTMTYLFVLQKKTLFFKVFIITDFNCCSYFFSCKIMHKTKLAFTTHSCSV